jgi:hypothetical protein
MLLDGRNSGCPAGKTKTGKKEEYTKGNSVLIFQMHYSTLKSYDKKIGINLLLSLFSFLQQS